MTRHKLGQNFVRHVKPYGCADITPMSDIVLSVPFTDPGQAYTVMPNFLLYAAILKLFFLFNDSRAALSIGEFESSV